MKKVSFFIGTLFNGGAERVVSNLSLELSDEIFKEILVYDKKVKIFYPFNGKLVFLDRERKNDFFGKINRVFSIIKTINRIKEQDKTTTISFLEYPNLINVMTYKKGKTIISVRNFMSIKHNNGIKSLFWNGTIRCLYPRADLIIAVSEDIKKDLQINYRIPEEKIRVIYNSYDIEKIKRLSSEKIEDEYSSIFDKKVIITAGRLNKQKGHWHLIRAFIKVKKTIPDAKLVILGEGETYKYLKKLAVDLKVDNDIYFLGFKENPFKYISNSKVFVLPSLYEGFPNVLAESMACGVPVISSDCFSGPREILATKEFGEKIINYDINKERYGILTPVCDGNIYNSKRELTEEENIMADKIIELLSNSELHSYFSEMSKYRIKEFDSKNIIKEWESII